MSEPIEITPELLADIEAKAKATLSRPGTWGFQGASAIHAFQSAANPAVVLAMVREIELLRSRRGWRIQAMLHDIELSIAAVNGSNESEDFVEDYCKCDREVGICCQYCQIFHTLKRCKSHIESEVEI